MKLLDWLQNFLFELWVQIEQSLSIHGLWTLQWILPNKRKDTGAVLSLTNQTFILRDRWIAISDISSYVGPMTLLFNNPFFSLFVYIDQQLVPGTNTIRVFWQWGSSAVRIHWSEAVAGWQKSSPLTESNCYIDFFWAWTAICGWKLGQSPLNWLDFFGPYMTGIILRHH